MYFQLLLTYLVICRLDLASSHSNGISETACAGLSPKFGHGPSTATGPAPYTLSLSSDHYSPGDVIQVTLSGTGGAQFKGYVIVARQVNGNTDNIGNFSPTPNSHNVCNGSLGNGVTQSNSSIKSSVTFNWTAPTTSRGDLVFHYTVVRGGAPNITPLLSDYYEGLVSATLKDATAISTTVAPATFTKNPECGKTRGCFSDCLNNVCTWEVSWKEAGDSYDTIMRAALTGDNHYFSIGVNNISAMSPASVVSCVAHSGIVEALVSHTQGHRNIPTVNPKDGISNETHSYTNGILQCSFHRETISYNPLIFNLTEPLYLITATGSTHSDGTLQYHGKYRFLSTTQIDFSNVTTDDAVPGIPPASPSPSTTASSGQTTAAPKTFIKNPECGKTRGCFSDCVSSDCTWELSWKEVGDKFGMTIKSVATGDNQYVALGVNKLGGMSPASVLSCVAYGGRVGVIVSYNQGYSNVPAANPKDGISNETDSYINGVLECSFFRETISSNPQIFNLTDPLYLITAKGNAETSGALGYHLYKYSSVTQIDFSNVTTDETFPGITTPSSGTTPVPPPASKFHKDPYCGVSKGCYSNCRNDVCDLLLSWADKKSYFEISLTSGFSEAGNYYIALGFGKTDQMSPASVVACIVFNGKVYALNTHNEGGANIPLSNPEEGLSNVTGSFKDGVLNCTFHREITSLNPNIYNLTEEWYLVSARGKASSNLYLSRHDPDQAYSVKSKIDFTNPRTDIYLSGPDFTLVKAHGCLMSIAWMLAASIGLAMARFAKKLWPDSKVCGVKIWFAVHRAVMVLAFVLGIAAFVMIFVYTDGYSDISGEAFKKAHPILGIIVTGLLFINPFMSLLRCGPDHPRRPIFNWAHWLVGTSAHILGGITITFGLYLPKSQVDTNVGLIIMIVYFSWHVLFFIIMSGIDYIENKPSKTVSTGGQPLELTGKHSPSINVADDISEQNTNSYKLLETTSKEAPLSNIKKLLLLAHFLILLALTCCIIYLIVGGSF